VAEVTAYEAKTHLPRLLRAVEQGESVTITRHGKPVARLVPFEEQRQAEVAELIERIKILRRRLPRVPLDEILAARHEGHKY